MNVQEELLHYPWHQHLRDVSKMLKVFMLNFCYLVVKFFMLIDKLSCMRSGHVKVSDNWTRRFQGTYLVG